MGTGEARYADAAARPGPGSRLSSVPRKLGAKADAAKPKKVTLPRRSSSSVNGCVRRGATSNTLRWVERLEPATQICRISQCRPRLLA
jgi:hypothetical protein